MEGSFKLKFLVRYHELDVREEPTFTFKCGTKGRTLGRKFTKNVYREFLSGLSRRSLAAERSPWSTRTQQTLVTALQVLSTGVGFAMQIIYSESQGFV